MAPAPAAEEEEMKRALLQATLELQSTRAAAQEELRQIQSQALHLADLLELAKRERDEARQALLLLHRHYIADDRHRRVPNAPNFDSSAHFTLDEENDAAAVEQEEEETSKVRMASPATPLAVLAEVEAAAARKGLPEKGRLVETVLEAGPLLHTLLLAGPLPQWRHPPPQLRSFDIPPVSVCLNVKGAAATTLPPSPLPASIWNHSSPSSSPESALTRLLATRLYRRYVILPLAADHLLSTIQSFRDVTGLPNVAGAIASSPVRLKRRRRLSLNDGSLRGGDNLGEDDKDLLLRSLNRGYPSILLQAVADHRKVFWDACVRAPGSSDPSSHLRDSRLYHSLLSSDKDGGGLFRDPVVGVHGHQVHPCLIGDASYPLLPCLLTPFSPGLSSSSSSVAATSPQEAFDVALAKGRSASVEAALALLKGRWKILRNLNVGLDHAAQTVVACVVLHNMCQFAKEPEDERRFMWRDPPERPQLATLVESEQPLYHAGESMRMSLAEELFERQQKLSGQR